MRTTPETEALHARRDAPRRPPDDPQAMLEQAQRLEALGGARLPEAVRLCADLITRFPESPLLPWSAAARTRISQASLRGVDHGDLREDEGAQAPRG